MAEESIGLDVAIEMLRRDFENAIRAGAKAPVQFPVKDVTVELSVVVTTTKEGEAGFAVPFVNAKLGGSIGRTGENSQKVTVTFGGPVDRNGNPIKVAALGDQDKG